MSLFNDYVSNISFLYGAYIKIWLIPWLSLPPLPALSSANFPWRSFVGMRRGVCGRAALTHRDATGGGHTTLAHRVVLATWNAAGGAVERRSLTWTGRGQVVLAHGIRIGGATVRRSLVRTWQGMRGQATIASGITTAGADERRLLPRTR